MSAAVKRKLTPAEYLAIERKAEFKSDFLNGEMFAMVGADRIASRILYCLPRMKLYANGSCAKPMGLGC
jgi:hypothetical protein